MGRIKEFEDIQVFEKAMYLFWEKGYGNTSLKELLEVMDIQNGSFYNTFGNKKTLFIKALESYEKDFAHKRNLLFDSGNGFKKNIRILFSHVFDRQKKTECPKGCFLFNSVSADALEDREIQTLVLRGVRDFESFLKDQIKIAIDNGEIDKSVEPNKTAAILVAYMQGMMKLCVLEYSDSKFKEQTKYFLSALNLS
jgi:TetR/AcrR family transcriptional repressor of nem operon